MLKPLSPRPSIGTNSINYAVKLRPDVLTSLCVNPSSDFPHSFITCWWSSAKDKEKIKECLVKTRFAPHPIIHYKLIPLKWTEDKGLTLVTIGVFGCVTSLVVFGWYSTPTQAATSSQASCRHLPCLTRHPKNSGNELELVIFRSFQWNQLVVFTVSLRRTSVHSLAAANHILVCWLVLKKHQLPRERMHL